MPTAGSGGRQGRGSEIHLNGLGAKNGGVALRWVIQPGHIVCWTQGRRQDYLFRIGKIRSGGTPGRLGKKEEVGIQKSIVRQQRVGPRLFWVKVS